MDSRRASLVCNQCEFSEKTSYFKFSDPFPFSLYDHRSRLDKVRISIGGIALFHDDGVRLILTCLSHKKKIVDLLLSKSLEYIEVSDILSHRIELYRPSV